MMVTGGAKDDTAEPGAQLGSGPNIRAWNPQSKAIRALLGEATESGGELHLYAGEMILVSGKVGDGTRRLIELLGTPNRWTQGQICFNGMNLASFDADQKWKFRRACPFVYSRNHLRGGLSVVENVSEGYGGKKASPENVEAAIECMELSQWAHKRGPIWTPQFEQRVAWARTLAMQSPAIVAQDAWRFLSRRLQRRLFQELYRRSEAGACVVLVSSTWPVTLAPDFVRWISLRKGRVHFDEVISRRDSVVDIIQEREPQSHLTWAEHGELPPPPPLSPQVVAQSKLEQQKSVVSLPPVPTVNSSPPNSRPLLKRPDIFRKRA